MQCPSCEFHNAPGNAQCARCAGRLDFSDVDIEPPRSGGGVLATPVGRVMRRTGYRVRDSATRARYRASDAVPDWPYTFMAASLIVPGLGLKMAGRPIAFRIIISIWATLVLLAALFFGTGFDTLLMLGAVSTHTTGITLLLMRHMQLVSMPRRILLGLAMYIVVFSLVYAPLHALRDRLVDTITINNTVPNTAYIDNDTLLISRAWTTGELARGDLIAIDIPPRIYGPNAWGHGGMQVDRVIGLAGDTVSIRGGVVYLNDQASPVQPVAPTSGAPDLEVTAAANQVIVIPSALRIIRGNSALHAEVLRVNAVVRREDVQGKVLGRLRPFHRVGAIASGAAVVRPQVDASGSSGGGV